MDPDETLRQIHMTMRQMALYQNNPTIKVAYADELVEHVINLDTWLKKGGFLPSDWNPTTITKIPHPRPKEEE